jgi:hypothetical protein
MPIRGSRRPLRRASASRLRRERQIHPVAFADRLSASALHCLGKARIGIQGMRTPARASLARNDAGRRRIGNIAVRIEPVIEPSQRPRMRSRLEFGDDIAPDRLDHTSTVGWTDKLHAPVDRVRDALDVAVPFEVRDHPGDRLLGHVRPPRHLAGRRAVAVDEREGMPCAVRISGWPRSAMRR